MSTSHFSTYNFNISIVYSVPFSFSLKKTYLLFLTSNNGPFRQIIHYSKHTLLLFSEIVLNQNSGYNLSRSGMLNFFIKSGPQTQGVIWTRSPVNVLRQPCTVTGNSPGVYVFVGLGHRGEGVCLRTSVHRLRFRSDFPSNDLTIFPE